MSSLSAFFGAGGYVNEAQCRANSTACGSLRSKIEKKSSSFAGSDVRRRSCLPVVWDFQFSFEWSSRDKCNCDWLWVVGGVRCCCLGKESASCWGSLILLVRPSLILLDILLVRPSLILLVRPSLILVDISYQRVSRDQARCPQLVCGL